MATKPFCHRLCHRRADVVAAVRQSVGTRFRPQGRTAGVGLDCIGVALIAARAAGMPTGPLPAYALNGENSGKLDSALVALGCLPVGAAQPGDLLVVAPSPRQRHVAVVTPGGVVHAHAGLGRVVESPLDPAWTIVGRWRLPGVH